MLPVDRQQIKGCFVAKDLFNEGVYDGVVLDLDVVINKICKIKAL